MIQFKINEKPLSVNLAWQGKRFKTPAYKKYEKEMLLRMPAKKVDANHMLRVEFFFCFRKSAA
jgi:hypothetical protein